MYKVTALEEFSFSISEENSGGFLAAGEAFGAICASVGEGVCTPPTAGLIPTLSWGFPGEQGNIAVGGATVPKGSCTGEGDQSLRAGFIHLAVQFGPRDLVVQLCHFFLEVRGVLQTRPSA